MKVGYVRVSSQGQNTARQEVLMQELGVERIFIDKQSGKDISRPELKKIINIRAARLKAALQFLQSAYEYSVLWQPPILH